jgi:hypothetical protein
MYQSPPTLLSLEAGRYRTTVRRPGKSNGASCNGRMARCVEGNVTFLSKFGGKAGLGGAGGALAQKTHGRGATTRRGTVADIRGGTGASEIIFTHIS